MSKAVTSQQGQVFCTFHTYTVSGRVSQFSQTSLPMWLAIRCCTQVIGDGTKRAKGLNGWCGCRAAPMHPCGQPPGSPKEGSLHTVEQQEPKERWMIPRAGIYGSFHTSLEVRRERGSFRKLLERVAPEAGAPRVLSSSQRPLGTEGWEGSVRPKELRSSGFTVPCSGEGTQG